MASRLCLPSTPRALLLAALLAGTGCGQQEETMDTPTTATLRVTSTAFEHEGAIPARFTCDGEDASPPLSWSPGPDGTVSYALIVEDPDAPGGTWVHWVAWNLVEPRLREGVAPEDVLADGTRQGRNSWKRTGYGGPCPPSGTHRYWFRVLALDKTLELPASSDAAALKAATRGHVLARGELLGLYTRAR
jgi:Raf kinase inhibitor-like YbhB/YbcL family protein